MTEADYRAKLDAIDERLSDAYNDRRKLMLEFAGRFPVVLPAERKNRSEKQQLVARCPRCSGPISEDGGAKK